MDDSRLAMTVEVAGRQKRPAGAARGCPVAGNALAAGNAPRSSAARLLLAAALPLLACSLQLAAWDLLEHRVWFLFYPAVFLAALFCGTLGGVVATVVTIPLVWYFFLPPRFSFALFHAGDGLSLAAFLLIGLSLSALGWRHQRTVRRLAWAEAALEERAMSTGIVDTAMDGIVTIDMHQRIVRFNRAAETLFGLPAAAALGQPLTLLLPKRHRAGHDAHVRRFLLSGETSRRMGHLMELNGVRADGSEFPIEAAISRTGTGEDALATVVLRDVTERRALQRRIDELTADLNEILDHLPAGASLWNGDRTNRFSNAAYAAALGTTPAELRGRPLSEVLDPDRMADCRDAIQAALAGTAQHFEREVPLPGGGVRHEQVTYVADGRSGGEPGLFEFVVDITARKHAEQEAVRLARRYQALYERTPAMIHAIDAGGILTSVSDAWEGKLGYTRDELLGRHVTAFMTPASREAVLNRHLPRHLNSGAAAAGIEFELEGKDGRIVEVALSSIQEQDPATGSVYRLGVLEDVTVRNRTLRALRDSEARYRLLVEDQSELVSLSAPDGTLQFVNRAYANAYGRTPAELTGRSLYDCLSPAERELVRERRQKVFDSGLRTEGEDRIFCRDGSVRWIAWTNRAVAGQDGTVVAIHSVGRDITERKALEASLQGSRSLLAKIGHVAGIGGWKLNVSNGEFVWSEQCCRIVGLPLDFRPGLDEMIAFYAPEVREQVRSRIAAAARGEGGFDGDFRFLRVDGRSIWVRTVVSVEFEGDLPARVIGAFHDVTQARAQRLRIEQLYAEAEQQRAELADYRQDAESEAELASFLLSRLARMEQLDDPGVSHYWLPAQAFSGDVIAAARSTGGDLYGLLADATGHGLAAAINLIPLTSAFYAMAAKGFNIQTIAVQMNKVVKEYSLADRFVAVTLVRFVQRENQLEVVNAGNPHALLVDPDGRLVREFRSGCVPLGILPRDAFRPVVETVELAGDEHLVMYSDGLVEACDARGEAFGRARTDAALAEHAAGANLVERLRTALTRFLGPVAPADDVSVLALRPVWTTESAAIPPVVHAAGVAASGRRVATAAQLPEPGIPTWRVETALSWRELRVQELVPVMVGLTRSLGLDAAVEGKLFTVLSELFVNALDHGLLGMDSALKLQPDGFERYFDARAARLAALAQGNITVSVQHFENTDGQGRLRLQVSDTGAGFDHRAVLAGLARDALEGNQQPCGRGIALVQRLSSQLAFNQAGNSVIVDLAGRDGGRH